LKLPQVYVVVITAVVKYNTNSRILSSHLENRFGSLGKLV